MRKKKIVAALNDQFNKELYSSYLYLAIANYYADQNLEGFQNWFEIQAKEELDHAMLFRKYLLNDNEQVSLRIVEAPDVTFSKLGEPLAAALEHEKMITESISEIYAEALEMKDFKATQFLDWFIKEQGEEEKNSNDLNKKFDLYCGDAKGLYLLNAELATRLYVAPALVI